LTPGLTGKYPAFDFVRGLSNNMNMMQLGLSGLHAQFTATDAAVSKMSLGVEKALSGQRGKGIFDVGLGGAGLIGQEFARKGPGANLIPPLFNVAAMQTLGKGLRMRGTY